jgi:hypothetical protein
MAGQQQVGHGGQVHLVGLDAPLAAGPPLPGHMRGVELDELPIGWQHAGGQQRTVVVASRPIPIRTRWIARSARTASTRLVSSATRRG